MNILRTKYATPINVRWLMEQEAERLVEVIPNPTSMIKVDYRNRIIRIGITVTIWFLFYSEYENWSKGKTYLFDGKFYHSGYPISEEQVKLSQTMPKGVKLWLQKVNK